MSWLELHLEVLDTEVEVVEQALLALGALSITVMDNANQPILEPPPDTQPLWTDARVIGLFDGRSDTDLISSLVRRQLPRSTIPCQWRQLGDRVWEREWLQHFKPLAINAHFWVHTDAVEIPGVTTLLLDPGLAFGTGTHPTTALCLDWIAGRNWEACDVLDLGCGSGILAIGALLRGARHAWCLDIDAQALTATSNNMARNGFGAGRYSLHRSLNELAGPIDLVVANILAGPLIELEPAIADCLRPNGHLCLSGILAEQAQSLVTAYQADFDNLQVTQREDWVRITGTRRAQD